MASGSDVVIRRSCEEDYAAVMDIDDNIYDGMDHLPVIYKGMVRDENSYMLVAELGGKVVGFTNYMMVGLNVVVAMTARTHPSCRGQGIASKLYKTSIQHYMGLLGNPILEYRTAKWDQRLDEQIKNSTNIVIVRHWNIVRYHFHLDVSLETLNCERGRYVTEKVPDSKQLALHTLTELQDILKLEGSVFPYHFTWIPMDINIENIAKAAQTVDFVLLTKRVVDHSICAFSLVSTCNVKCGPKADIWLYSREHDVDICRAHLYWVLTSLIDKFGPAQSIGLLIHFPKIVPAQDMVNVLRPAIGERYCLGPFQNTSALALIKTYDMLPK